MRRALIVTTLRVEHRAVHGCLSQWQPTFDRLGIGYERGVLEAPSGDWEVLLAQCDRYNAPAAVALERALSFWKPQVALFVGIAGGLKDVQLGDVVAADVVFNYEAAKAARQLVPRLLPRESSFRLVELAKVLARGSDWLDSSPVHSQSLPPQVFVVPVASGEKVVTARDTDVHAFLRTRYENAVAVETEGYGFLTAARGREGLEAMVVRGISDLIDGKPEAEAEGWQERASRNAAAFAFALLARFQGPTARVRRETDPMRDGTLNLFREKTQQLLGWPQLLPGQRWIDRPELRKLLHRIEHEPSSRTVLLGRPGSGKSALLARLGSVLADREDVVLLAIKADRLPPGVATQKALQRWLGLRVPLTDLLQKLCQSRTVVLVLDQLDALSEFVDLRTHRLDVLLELLQQLGETPNLHIVASCRLFDFQHDVRFARFPPEMTLPFELPEWSQVEAVLLEAGMNPSGWPEKFREVLRTPQHLKIFLQHFSETGKPFPSYQQMLEELWRTQVLRGRGLDKLVFELAVQMTDQEELWLPLARFDKQRKKIDQLVARGVLNLERMRIGFTHQTLLEFARGRAFATGREHLDTFVLARQATLSIRPKLLGSLEYLRELGGTTYQKEFERLWSSRELRPHVRALMLDFLGQLDDPSDEEMGWLLEALRDSAWLQHALRAVAGSAGWFARLAPRQLPFFMRGTEEQARAVLPVLVQGWRIDREQVLNLLEQHWMRREDRQELALMALRRIDRWNERAVEVITFILRRASASASFATYVASLVSEQAPALAPKVFAASLESRMRRIVSEGRERAEVDNDYRDLLRAMEWYAVPKIAAAAPVEFLQALWPGLMELLKRFAKEPHPFVTGYARSRLMLHLSDEGEGGADAPFVKAISVAVIGTARKAPLEFLGLVREWSDCAVLEVHQLFAKGLCQVAETHPKKVLEYLLGDPRRLVLGDFPDEHADTCALIGALVPRLEAADQSRLEEQIKQWKYYFGNVPPSDRADPLWRVKNEREHRLRLLMAIPEERRSADTRRLIREEVLAIGAPKESAPRSHRLRAVESPMSSEQMSKAHVEDILGLFEELTDDKEWDHPRRKWKLVGGSIEAARAFADFAAQEPRRAIEYMRRFTPGTQERPVAYALRTLARSGLEPAELSQLVTEFDSRGFRSDMFREEAADVLEHVARRPKGLSEELQSLLASWLRDEVPQAPSDSEEFVVRGSDPNSRPQPVLGGLGGVALPGGNYPVLCAMLRGYLARVPAATEQAFALLLAHLERREQPEVWRTLCYSHLIPLLHEVGPEQACAFMWKLLSHQPRVIGSREGAYLLNAARWWSPPKALQVWVWLVRSKDWKEGAQGFGELVVRVALVNGHDWAKRRLEEILSGRDPRESELPSLRLGVAFAASQLFEEPEFREGAADLLGRLMPGADDHIAMAIMGTFHAHDGLMDDPGTVRLLESLLKHPEILRGGVYQFVETLGALVTTKPVLVVKLCEAVLDQLPRHAGMDASRSTLVNLALTLERQQRSRSQGLELFERMLTESTIALEAEEALRQSDGRRSRVIPDTSAH